MPDTRRINMRKIRDVLRLKLEARLSHEQTAAALGVSKGVITKYLTLVTVAGLDWLQIQALDAPALHNRLLGTPQRASGFVPPDYGRIHQELRRKGMTLMLLWEEHTAQHPGEATHRYSQFCENYRRYAKSLKRSMRQIHRAGERLFIDYAGPTVELIDGSRAHVFGAALGASSYTYATPRETMADWLGATALALRFFGGVPQLIVPDNHYRLPRRIRAHALVCFVALILYRVMRMRLKAARRSESPATLLEQLKRIQQQTVQTGDGKTLTGLTEMTPAQKSLFAVLDLTPPTPSDLAKPVL